MNLDDHKHFFITGVSSGFGRAFALAALTAGHRVTGTLRSEQAALEFQAMAPGRAVAQLLDVTDHAAVQRVVTQVEQHAPVDVLINNAGYGHEGILEESPMEELRRQFEVNVFGVVAVIRAFLPYMRARRRGRIINITSMGGYITMPGMAYYCGSKFALEGISEALGKEVASLGIDVTAVAPGSFRTHWAGRSMVRTARSIDDYDSLFDPVRTRRQQVSGRQLGDPEKAAAVVLDLATSSRTPPAHLLLGSDAFGLVHDKLTAQQAELKAWEQVSRSTDGPIA